MTAVDAATSDGTGTAPPARDEAAPPVARRFRIPTVADRFDGRRNAIGLLRHILAFTVLAAHSWQVGYNALNPTVHWWRGQTQLGSMGVFGFFALSGFLITGSGMKLPLGRFIWHRFLRIYPGLWACLAVCAFVIAPAVALSQGRSLSGFWHASDSPSGYITHNFFAAIEQPTIAGLFADTPYGNGAPTFVNVPLWSLRYELLCYVGVGVLAAVGVLRRARFVVPLILGALWAALILHTVRGTLDRPQPFGGSLGPVPLLGEFSRHELVILAFLFLCGVTMQVYRDRVPMHGSLALVAAAALVGSLWFGGFLVIGLFAYAYLLLYVAVALPARLDAIGRRWDYSYGIYIYGYPVQLVLAVIGVQRLGLVPYTAAALVGTLLFAVPSWHLVEKRAMALKNVQFVRPAATQHRANSGEA